MPSVQGVKNPAHPDKREPPKLFKIGLKKKVMFVNGLEGLLEPKKGQTFAIPLYVSSTSDKHIASGVAPLDAQGLKT